MKKHKTAALLFPSLITSICVVSGVRITAQDERIKNNGAFTTRTIKRIIGEATAAPTKLVVVAGTKRVVRVEMRIQELSDSIIQCAEAQ